MRRTSKARTEGDESDKPTTANRSGLTSHVSTVLLCSPNMFLNVTLLIRRRNRSVSPKR